MQARFWLSNHPTFELAKKAKDKSENDNPEGRFQIRKGRDKDNNIVFRLVERFTISEAKVIKTTKENKKRRKKKNAVDVSWIRG